MQNILTQLGFTKNEMAVYLALFSLGKVRAKEIIEDTKLHRNLVYTSLDTLVARRLVSKTIVSGVAEFVANDPTCLIDEQEEKKRLATQASVELRQLQQSAPREVAIYEGNEAMQQLRNKMIDDAEGEEIYVFGASPETSTPEWETFWKQYHKKRVSKNTPLKMFYTAQSDQELLTSKNKLPQTEAKYLPFSASLPVWFSGAGDHFEVAITGDDPLTFYIKSREVVEGFRTFFEYFWKQKVSSVTGYDEVFRAFDDMLDALEPGDTYYVIGANAGALDNAELRRFYESFHLRRIQKKVNVRMIASKNSYADISERFDRAGDVERKLSHLKQFPSFEEQPFQINLSRGKALLYVYTDPPTVITFDDPEVYHGFKLYFDTLWNQESHVITGADAVRDLWIQTLEYDQLCFIGARGYFLDRFPKQFQEVLAERDRRGVHIPWRIISDAGVQGHALSKLPWVETKYVLPSVPSPNVVWLFGNTVAVVNWTDDQPVVFVSTNLHLVQSYRDYFEAMWQQPELN